MITTSSFTANWGAAAYANGYQLDVSTSGDFSSGFVLGYSSLSVVGTSQSVSPAGGLSPNTNYYYRVRSLNSSGMSTYSNPSAVVTIPLSPTADAASDITSTSFVANWSANAGNAPGAVIYQLEVLNSTSTIVYSNLGLSSTSYTVTGLSGNTNYSYRVRAANANGASVNSNTQQLLTSPSAPVATSATLVASNSFTANWGGVSGASGYLLDVWDNENNSVLTDFSIANTSYTVSNLNPFKNYTYRVRAVSNNLQSGYSNNIITKTLLSTPVSLNATGVEANAFVANWQSVAFATGYELDISSDQFGTVLKTIIVNGDTFSKLVDDINLRNNSYSYRVRSTANDETVESLNSLPITISQLPAIPNNYNYVISLAIQSDKKADGSAITEIDIPSLPVHLKAESTTYFDGLGRPMQTVTTQGSPTKKDLVSPIAYDGFGRENIKYLPYISLGTDGLYKPSSFAEQASFYTSPPTNIVSDLRPFSETIFEPSPLNRPAKQFGPGLAWKDNRDLNNPIEKPVIRSYLINVLNEVYLFGYDITTGLITWAGVNSATGFYDAGQLYANKTTDEQGHEVIEYVDKEGRTICKKVEASGSGSGKVYASTYYVYDDLGNLAVVLPPEGVKELTK